MQLESAHSKQNTISKYLFHDSFQRIFCGNEKNASYFLKKAAFIKDLYLPDPAIVELIFVEMSRKVMGFCEKESRLF